MNIQEIKSKLEIYSMENVINSSNEQDVSNLLVIINQTTYNDRKDLTFNFIEKICNIYFNMASYYDLSIAPLKASEMARYYLKCLLEYKIPKNEEKILLASKIFLRNSIKEFLFNNNLKGKCNDAIEIIKRFESSSKYDITSNKDIINYINLINNKKFEFDIQFELPFPIYIDYDKNVKLVYDSKEYSINFELVSCKNFFEVENGIMTCKSDRYGIYNKTLVKMKSNIIVEGKKDNKEYENYSYIVDECIFVLNTMIDCIKLTDNFHWIQRINKSMLRDFSLNITKNNEKFYGIVYSAYDENELMISNSLANLMTDEDITHIINKYINGYQLWEMFLAEAKDYFEIGKFKEVIIMVNIAFENYIEVILKKKLSNIIGEAECNDFWNGKLNYDNWEFKDKFTVEQFNSFREIKLIEEKPPTIFKILKKYKVEAKLQLSKKSLDNYIRKIRACRNDITHGREHNLRKVNLENISKNTIAEFENFIKIIES